MPYLGQVKLTIRFGIGKSECHFLDKLVILSVLDRYFSVSFGTGKL